MSFFPASRRALGSAGAVLAGGFSAALFAVALMHAGTALVLMAYIAGIPLFLAGLSVGSVAGLVASATGVVGLYLSQPSALGTTYALFNAVPAMLLVMLALRHRTGIDQKTYWYPEGFLMTALALYPCTVFLAVVIMTFDQTGGLLAMTTASLHQTVDLFQDKIDPNALMQFTNMIDYLARMLPAFAGCAWMIITMLCMVCAQNILIRQKWSIRPAFSLQALHIPAWMIFAVAVTGLVSQFAPAPFDYIGINLSILLGMPFFFVGLAIVHAWAATFKSPKVVLAIFYILASLVVWSSLLVAALGVIDEWFNFRQRFAVRPKRT